jgi:lipid-binding SYLF domain-containing protein
VRVEHRLEPLTDRLQVGDTSLAPLGAIREQAVASLAEPAGAIALKTEAVSYTRSRRLFAGVELEGAVVEQDVGTTASLYGRLATFQQVLSGGVPISPEARPFVVAVSDTF